MTLREQRLAALRNVQLLIAQGEKLLGVEFAGQTVKDMELLSELYEMERQLLEKLGMQS